MGEVNVLLLPNASTCRVDLRLRRMVSGLRLRVLD